MAKKVINWQRFCESREEDDQQSDIKINIRGLKAETDIK